MLKKPETPFPVSGYRGPAYFCDREQEIKELRGFINGGIPTVILGIRRLGKTGLIRHLFHQHHPAGIFVDLQGTDSLTGLVGKLAEGIAMAFPEKKHTRLWSSLKNMRPILTFDPLSGSPQFGFQFQETGQLRNTLRDLLGLLSSQKEKVVIAFDEFQQILNYPEETIEGILRTEIQQFPGINFLFSGSQTHLLSAMFYEGSRPFFANTAKLYLDKLPKANYAAFIGEKFREYNKVVEEGVIDEILEWTETHTYYTQFVCNQLCLYTEKKVQIDQLRSLQWRILQTSKQDFFQIRDLLSKPQWKVLVAIAKEQEIYHPYSKAFNLKYNLSTPAGIKKAIQALLDRQLINVFHDDKGAIYYKTADVFLMRFIQNYL